jgi:hypothetical protein
VGKEDANTGGVWFEGNTDFERWNFCDEVADSFAEAIKRAGVSAAEIVLAELKSSSRFGLEPEDETADMQVSLYIFDYEAQFTRSFVAMIDDWIEGERRLRSHREALSPPIKPEDGPTRVDDMIAALANALDRVRSAFG